MNYCYMMYEYFLNKKLKHVKTKIYLFICLRIQKYLNKIVLLNAAACAGPTISVRKLLSSSLWPWDNRKLQMHSEHERR